MPAAKQKQTFIAAHSLDETNYKQLETENTTFQPRFWARGITVVVSRGSVRDLGRRTALINKFDAQRSKRRSCFTHDSRRAQYFLPGMRKERDLGDEECWTLWLLMRKQLLFWG